MLTTDQLRKLIEDRKTTIGTTSTLKALKQDKLKRLVLASNASQTTQEAVKRYSEQSGVPIDELSVPNDELGVMCKKPFSIALLGIKK
jgi:ribosomal protein L30E